MIGIGHRLFPAQCLSCSTNLTRKLDAGGVRARRDSPVTPWLEQGKLRINVFAAAKFTCYHGFKSRVCMTFQAMLLVGELLCHLVH